MPFYIRKSFKFGPLRLNLSKSGLGASAGVTGLRVGTGPKGDYVHAGRGGLYFRKNLRASPDHSQHGDDGPAVQPERSVEGPAASDRQRPKDWLARSIRKLFRGR